MEELEVYFQTMDDVVAFVRRANQIEEDVDLRFGHILVDAKSLQGVIAMGLGSHARAVIHSTDQSLLEVLRGKED